MDNNNQDSSVQGGMAPQTPASSAPQQPMTPVAEPTMSVGVDPVVGGVSTTPSTSAVAEPVTPTTEPQAPVADVQQPMAPQMPSVGGDSNSGNTGGGDQGGVPPVTPGV